MLQQEIDNIAKEIAYQLERRKPSEWTTWDSFAGRMRYRKESETNFRVKVIRTVLESYLGEESVTAKD